MSAERSVARLQEDRAWSLAIRVRRPVDLARVGWPGVDSRDPGTTPGHGQRLTIRQEWPWLLYIPALAARYGKVSYSVFAWRVAGEVEKTARVPTDGFWQPGMVK